MPRSERKNAYDVEYALKNPEKILKWRKTAYQNYINKPGYAMWCSAKQRAKQEDYEFSITVQDIIDVTPEFCPILEMKLERTPRKASAKSPSLDRFDNTKGYTKENIRVISYKANSHKSDMTLGQIERLFLYMKGEL